ncbi:MAG: Coenzyme PQQ synthesis protein E [Bacteroidia bacterium]|nr:Coenzyme PQQ synthesis protein E [Bacteroidia bacterium]
MSYAQSLSAFHLNGTPRPFSASFAITNKCNLKCAYCDLPNIKAPELSVGQMDILFKKLRKLGILRLGIFGGEPLVRKDIGEILQLAKRHGFFTSLNSNMLLYDRYKDVLSSVDYFFVSLDGTPEKHIANRGKQNYEIILESIRDIVQRKKKLTAICVVTDPDIVSADYLIGLAIREKIDVHFQPESYDAECAGRTAPNDLHQQETKKFWQYLLEKKREGAPITSSTAYLKYLINWHNYKESAVYDPSVRCMAGSGFISIDPSGTAYPCIFTKGKAEGINLMEHDWAEKFDKKTACTKCIVGPLLEYNLLFHKPVSSVIDALAKIN